MRHKEMSEKAKLMIEKLRTTSIDKSGDMDAVSFGLPFLSFSLIIVFYLL